MDAMPASPKVRPSSALALVCASSGSAGGGGGDAGACCGEAGAAWKELRAPGGAGLNRIAAAAGGVAAGDTPVLIVCTGLLAAAEDVDGG
jgi:hypothetical protein